MVGILYLYYLRSMIWACSFSSLTLVCSSPTSILILILILLLFPITRWWGYCICIIPEVHDLGLELLLPDPDLFLPTSILILILILLLFHITGWWGYCIYIT
jgi:hypothetical protein